MRIEYFVLINMLCYVVFFGPTPLLLYWLATSRKLSPVFILAILVIYVSTSIWAVREARRVQFRDYKVSLLTGGITTAIGCFWLWAFCFPWFLANRRKILHGRAARREADAEAISVSFTLLLVGTPFLAFMGVAVPPSLFQSRLVSGELSALSCLRNYHAAQLVVSSAATANVRNNVGRSTKYCDNFRNLYYGKSKTGDAMQLFPKEFADAFAKSTRGMDTAGECAIKASPYNGYLFFEDPFMVESGDWNENFALVAYPSEFGVWGRKIFWIDARGQVFSTETNQEKGSPPQLLRVEESPLFPGCTRDWEGL